MLFDKLFAERKNMTRLFTRFVPGLALFSLTTLAWAAKKPDVAGTYIIQGGKGAIVLALQDEPENKVSGSLNGGDLNLTLKGLPEGETGGVIGSMTDANGQFMSYFRAYREGKQMILEMIEATPGGDPDFTKKSRIPFPAGAAPAPAAPAAPANSQANPLSAKNVDFTGTFKDENLTVESKVVPGQTGVFSGTIKMGAQNFKFTARSDEGALRGEFESPDGKFPFEARLEGRTLNFVTAGTTYRLNQQGGNPLANPLAKSNNPLARPNTPAPANPLAKPSGTAPNGAAPNGVAANLPDKSASNAAWKIYKHPTGLSVRYPPTWQVQEVQGMLTLTPPDVAKNANGALEAYIIGAEGAEGVQSVDDPRVAMIVEQKIKEFLPLLQRVGQPKRLAGNTAPALLMSWESDNPGGVPVRANVMTAILKGYGVTLLALGDKTKIAAREGVLKEIFASLAAGTGERDPNLVGGWKFWSYKSSANGKFSTETKRRFQFMPDGTCLWQSTAESAGSAEGRDSLGNQTFTGGFASQRGNGNGDRGQWTAGGGKLYVLWDDGTTGTWDYEVKQANGKKLFLTGANNKPDEWMAE
jgi:hypothetical protein